MRSARRCGGGDGPCQCKGSRRDVLRHPMSRSFPDSAMQRRPSGREQETQRVSPPVRNGAPQTGRSGNNGRPAPAVGGAGAGRGLWPPAGPGTGAALRQGRWPLPLVRFGASHSAAPGGTRKRPAFPPPVRNGAPQTGRSGTSRRPAPNPAGAKRPPWAGRALAGGALAPGGRAGRTAQSQSDGPGQAARNARRRKSPLLSVKPTHMFSTFAVAC